MNYYTTLKFPRWSRAVSPAPDHAVVAARLWQAFTLPPGMGGVRMDERRHELDAAVHLAKEFRRLMTLDGDSAFLNLGGGELRLTEGAYKLLRACWFGEERRQPDGTSLGLRNRLGVGQAEEIALVDTFLNTADPSKQPAAED